MKNLNPKPSLETDFFVDLGDRRYVYQLDSNADVLAILGPSGYGKSTFLNALLDTNKVTGFIKYRDVWVSSKENINLPIQVRPLAWVPQSHFLFPHLNVSENLNFGVADPVSFLSEIDSVIEALDIRQLLGKRPQKISGGETQRVAIGRALISTLRFSNGGLLLLDEPYASLDAELTSQISRFILEWCSTRRITPVFSVHEMDRIGEVGNASETTIGAYLLTESGREIRTEAVALPSSEKTV